MFSGIVEGTGKVLKIEDFGEGKKIYIKTKFLSRVGESISVNGACLTVVRRLRDVVAFDISPETLRRTNFVYLKVGDEVNIERAMKFSSRISGHFVLGHIDTTSKILDIEGNIFKRFYFSIDRRDMIFEKSFICIDGISLTVSSISQNFFTVDVIPETLRRTNLKSRKVGDIVNIEFDFLIKSIKRIIEENIDIIRNIIK